MRSALVVAILVCGFALTPGHMALAQDACTEPQAPAPVDGAQVSEDQMRAAAAAARAFIAQSDVYQSCLVNAVDAAKTQAAADGRPFDPALASDAKAKTDANQKMKERVGAEINAAIGAYKKTRQR